MLFFLLFACSKEPNLYKVEPVSECRTQASSYGQLPSYFQRGEFTQPISEGKTGVYLLEDGAGSLAIRAWLAEQATKTIDVQYFIYSADNVGLISTAVLVEAAERGVKVRILVDDILAYGDADLLSIINEHDNVEVRIYNPNINIGKNIVQKVSATIRDFEEINQRMHNKTYIVDRSVSITGGRNLGDEYFDFNSDYNFRDRDVALLGGATNAVQDSFDHFWDDPHAVNISSLLETSSSDHVSLTLQKLLNYPCHPENYDPNFRKRVDAVFETFRDEKDRKLQWVDDIQFISDAPGKNETEGLKGGGLTTQALIELVDEAQKRLWIQTPYLVLSELGLSVFQKAEERGVDVKILTNSLASTDNYPAFAGYIKIRDELKNIGVEVYEMKPYAPDVMSLNTSGIPDTMDAKVGLHSKSLLIDNHISMIGSFNLDPRSANLNTECIVIVRDENITKEMAGYFEREMSEQNAWPSDPKNEKEAPLKDRILTWFSRLFAEEIL